MNHKNKSIILLSGGLDSVVSLGLTKEEYNITLALTFDYGQKAKDQEISASKNIAEHFNIQHQIISVPWLKQITDTSLVSTEKSIPEINMEELDITDRAEKTAQKVWVPNRNGLFVNIAASFADSYKFTHIIFGANKEEAATFPDNSQDFIEKITKSLEYSTLVRPKVVAPLINYNKKEIVQLGLEKQIPFSLIRSCYTNNNIHCGKCESCLRLKRAISESKNGALYRQIFGDS